MGNAKIVFTKSYERVIRIDSLIYKIVQNQDEQTLCVYDENCKCIYQMLGQESAVIYDVESTKLITRVLHQAQIDRYALHK
jgi:hypothetical protein